MRGCKEGKKTRKENEKGITLVYVILTFSSLLVFDKSLLCYLQNNVEFCYFPGNIYFFDDEFHSLFNKL